MICQRNFMSFSDIRPCHWWELGLTGKPPSLLLFGRVINNKLPGRNIDTVESTYDMGTAEADLGGAAPPPPPLFSQSLVCFLLLCNIFKEN